MKLLTGLLVSLAALGLVACGGGSGSGGYSHAQVASDFVDGLNYDYGDDFYLVKTNTLQYDYIVVYDDFYGEYNAYDISDFYVGDSVDYYLDNYDYRNYYNLDYLGGNYYEDYESGIQFSKVQMTSADSAKAHELIDGLRIKSATEKLTVQFGLGPKRAKEIAFKALELKKEDKSKMTTFHYDQYSQAILGSTFSEIQGALQDKLSGNNSSLDAIYGKAAKANGISKAKVEKLADLFIKN